MYTRRSRTSRAPQGISIRITPLTVEILTLLNDYKRLPTSFLRAFTGKKGRSFSEKLARLYHEKIEAYGAPLLARDDSFGAYFSKQEVHMLSPTGIKASKDLGIELQSMTIGAGKNKHHEILLIATVASIEIECKKADRKSVV